MYPANLQKIAHKVEISELRDTLMKQVPAATANLPATLKLLSDPVRLRLCALLSQAELAVQELVAVTGLQQSRISNHLSLLKRAGLVRDRREGTWSFHSLVGPGASSPLTEALFAAAIAPWRAGAEGAVDTKALQAVLDQRRARSREAHDRLAARWSASGEGFALGTLRAELLAAAWPCRGPIADLGCGTGFLASWLASRGAVVVGVDHSERMLERARALCGDAVQLRLGELDALPVRDGEVAAVFANLVWHHLPDLDAAAREVLRVLQPGGTVVIGDLVPHRADWMREAMGDLRLGLEPEAVLGALLRAGAVDLRAERVADRYCATDAAGQGVEFPMFLVAGRKPTARHAEAPPAANRVL